MKIVSAVFNSALRQGYIASNPCTALERLPEKTAERSTFTSKQVAKLVNTAEGDWKNLILPATTRAARLSDLANMHWNAIDLNNRLITFTAEQDEKTGDDSAAYRS